MTFMLSKDRQGPPTELREKFERYQDYLRSQVARFPQSAYQIATSEWYYSLTDPRSPHDGWLTDLQILEGPNGKPDSDRSISIRLRLLNAQQDRHIEYWYPRVSKYTLELANGEWGHRDWRFDEFRLAEDGQVIHEIEWAAAGPTGHWVIVAADVQLRYLEAG